MRPFLKHIATAQACCAILASCNAAQPLKMLVGTYTQGNDSQGVYLYEFNAGRNDFKLIDTEMIGNPSFIIPSPDKRLAYGVSEFSDGSEAACAFRLEAGSIKLINCVSTNLPAPLADDKRIGGDPCNIIIAGAKVLTSNYTGGSITSFPIAEDGSLKPVTESFSPLTSQEQCSHMHCAILSPDGRYLFANDLGTDTIFRFNVKEDGPDLSSAQIAFRFDSQTHPGPRHSVFSADGRFMYLICELDDTLCTFRYNDGNLELISSQKAYDGEGHGSADIHISPDGKFLYTSHRLKDDGISIFSRNQEDGSVTRVGFQPTGRHPRNFAITDDNRYLLCACRDDNRIEVYRIDKKRGSLSDTGRKLEIPAPVCIQLFQ